MRYGIIDALRLCCGCAVVLFRFFGCEDGMEMQESHAGCQAIFILQIKIFFNKNNFCSLLITRSTQNKTIKIKQFSIQDRNYLEIEIKMYNF